MNRIELYCERKPNWESRAAAILAAEGFSGATLTETIGLWENELEQSFRVDVLGASLTEETACELAEALAVEFKQQGVLYVYTDTTGKLYANVVAQDGALTSV